jgi:hypothetical protein
MLLHPPLAPPKDGHRHRIIGVARVSSPDKNEKDPGSLDDKERSHRKQNILSLEDQERSYRELLDREIGQDKYELVMIAGSGSGELLNRKELDQLVMLIETRAYDLVLCEDLGRIARRMFVFGICELCQDCKTRLHSKNDGVDTAQPEWKQHAVFAAFHHERSNQDTSLRIKRSLRNRFMIGKALRRAVYGIIKPKDVKHDSELSKDPAAEPIYKRWFEILDDGGTFEDVVQFLKANKVKFPSRKRDVFKDPDAKSVARITYNPILKGVREHNNRKTRRINDPGKYVSEPAPKEDLLRREVAHLAYFEPAYYDRVVAKVRDRNARYHRTADPAADPLRGRCRKESRFPGKVTYCGICGRQFVWGGHGQTDHLMCNGARAHRCWMGISFNGPLAAKRIGQKVIEAVAALPEFDETFLAMLTEEGRRLDRERQQRLDAMRSNLAQVEGKIANIVSFITAGKAGPTLAAELEKLEAEKVRLGGEIEFVASQPADTVEIPSAAEIRKLVTESVKGLAVDSREFAQVMRKLVSHVVVFPVRLCDGDKVVMRAKLRLHLASLLPDKRAAELLRQPLSNRIAEVDLFDPTQRVKHRAQIVTARAGGKTERQAAEACGITVTAAQKAAALQRTMDALGLSHPYVLVTEPPSDIKKMRRHLHRDYRFEPLPGAGEV